MDCVFCKILRRELSAVKLFEDEYCIVVLDKFPATKGQALVITKKHEDYIMDLDEVTYHHIFAVAKRVARAIDTGLGTVRTCFVVEGLQVPHVHIRLHPIYKENEERSGEASFEELDAVAAKVKPHLLL